MMRRLLNGGFRRFARQKGYDTTYMQQVTDAWPGAGLRYLFLPALTRLTGPVPDIWAGAILASVLDGDCGACAQLVCDDAVAMGVAPSHLAACLRRDFQAAGDVGLGYLFAEAAIEGAQDTDALRAEIVRRHGARAAIAAAFAAASGRVYPVLKRGLGHGAACQRIKLGAEEVAVVRSEP
jgi:hypothetical protein